MSMIALFLIVIPFFICVPALIGVYVFRDAKRRNMNAPLWTLIAIIAPSLLGFLIYLLVRSSHSDLKCPQCAAPVTERYAVCPHCGARLKAACPNCAATVEPGWKLCPQCATPLPETVSGCTPPVRHKDRWIGRILAVVIIVPIVLILLLFLAFQATNRTGAMNTSYLTPESYLDAKADHWTDKELKEVQLWLDTCLSDPNRAYVLHQQKDQNGQTIQQYLVYYPAADPCTSIDSDLDTALLGTKLTVNFAASDEVTEYTLCTISVYADRAPRLEVQSDGAVLEYEITDVDYDYGLTFFEIRLEP